MILRNVLIAAAVIVFGVVFRIGSSVPVLITELVYQPPAGGIIPRARSAESAAKRFYMLLNDGRYKEAWELAIEPDWVESDRPAPYRLEVAAKPAAYQGLTSAEEFQSRLAGEMGPRGIFLSLSHIKSAEQKDMKIELPYKDVIEYPEYSSIKAVKVRGDYLASCAIYRWEKIIPVLKTSDGYRVVLDGTKNSKENYYLNWLNFAEKTLIKSLRGTPKKGAL